MSGIFCYYNFLIEKLPKMMHNTLVSISVNNAARKYYDSGLKPSWKFRGGSINNQKSISFTVFFKKQVTSLVFVNFSYFLSKSIDLNHQYSKTIKDMYMKF